MASGRRRKKTVITPPCDMISDLPVHIIETILVCLPLRDAVRTSILSRKWRYNWVRIPQLVFDYTFCPGLEKNQLYSKEKLMTTIYEVLLRHRGPILKFTLSVFGLDCCSKIDQLIHFLSMNGVEEITLQGWWDNCYEPYKLPSSFFSCLQLRRLELQCCVFKPPPVFNGFSRLISLYFNFVNFDAELIGDFISSCPLLEQLSLTSGTKFDYLEIDAPKLKCLSLLARVYALRFKNTPLLQSLLVRWYETERLEHLEEGQSSKLIEVFGSLPIIEDLRLGYRFMKASASTNGAEGPVLQLFEVPEYLDFSLNHLREVRVWFESGVRPALEFIKLLLANSPLLEKVDIFPPFDQEPHQGLRILQQLTRFRRASPKAEIFYPLDSDSDSDEYEF